MEMTIHVVLKPLRLSGRAAEYARRAMGLPDPDQPLNISAGEPLSTTLIGPAIAPIRAVHGTSRTARRIDTILLPAEALVDVYNVAPSGERLYHRTAANPVWWTPARILLAWIVADGSDATLADPKWRFHIQECFASKEMES